jgi:hypothetical protein
VQTASACQPTKPTNTNNVTNCQLTNLPCNGKLPDHPQNGFCYNDWAIYEMNCGYNSSTNPSLSLVNNSVLANTTGSSCQCSGVPQYLCSSLNQASCPAMGSAQAQAVNWYQPNHVNATVGLVQCDYALSDLVTSATNVSAWMQTFMAGATGASGATPLYAVDSISEQGYQNLMFNYCQQSVNNCVNGMSQCSRVFENVPNNPCSAWWNRVQSSALAGNSTAYQQSTNFVNQYCSQRGNQSSPDCACYNSRQIPAYEAYENAAVVAGIVPSQLGCYWVPCMLKGGATTLIPSDMFPSTCPADTCLNIIEIMGKTNISQSTIDQYVSCAGNGIGPAAPPGPFGIATIYWVIGLVVLVAIAGLFLLALGLRKLRQQRLMQQLSP